MLERVRHVRIRERAFREEFESTVGTLPTRAELIRADHLCLARLAVLETFVVAFWHLQAVQA